MLPKTQRFSRDDFPTKRPDERRTFSWGTVSLYSAKKPGAAVVVSKKAIKEAHDRNRAKRRVYNAFDQGGIEKTVGRHLKKEALTAPFEEIKKNLKEAIG